MTAGKHEDMTFSHKTEGHYILHNDYPSNFVNIPNLEFDFDSAFEQMMQKS